MVYSPKLSFVANGSNPTDVDLAPDETICFSSLEFTTDSLCRLCLSPQEGDSGALFVWMGTVGHHLCIPPSRIPPMKAALPRVKREATDPSAPEGAM
jgi:hypothetical protein